MVTKKALSVLTLSVFVTAGIAILPRPANAGITPPDLTGTWEGKSVCVGLDGDGDSFKETTKPSIAKITQSGDDLNIDADGTLYNGRVQGSAADPNKGAVIFIDCGTSPNLASDSEMGFAEVAVEGDEGKAKGFSAFREIETANNFGACKFSYKRTSTADPGVAACL